MPIIIWGSRGLTKNLEQGEFYCPGCDSQRDYHLRQVREFFTLYFIPLFPVGKAQRYIECDTCKGTYKEEVLTMEPPSDMDRFMARLYQDLQEGTSVEETENRLVELGLERSQAETIVKGMTEDKVWQCDTCGEHYRKGVRKCKRCRG
jgi:hypothetical protein